MDDESSTGVENAAKALAGIEKTSRNQSGGDEASQFSTSIEEVYALASNIKEMVADNVHFVFFWGLPQAGKTHILFTIWLCLEQLGKISPYGVDGDVQVQFRYHLDEFSRCIPAQPTKWDRTYMISCTFTPNSTKYPNFPPVRFAFVEAAGETTANQLTKEKVYEKSIAEIPNLHNAILLNPESKVSHILVPSVTLPSTIRLKQDANLAEVLNVIEKKRSKARETDDFLLTLSKWDALQQEDSMIEPLQWLEKNVNRTLAQFTEMSIKSRWAYYQTYITANWAEGKTADNKNVSYAQNIKLDSANCLVHWLYRAATGKLLFPEKEPKAPPTATQLGLAKVKRFFAA